MKFYYFAVIIVGIMILLNAGGIQTPVTGTVLSTFGISAVQGNVNIVDIKSSTLWSSLALLLGGLATAGIVIGFFGGKPDVSYVKAGLVLVLAGLIMTDLISLAQILMSYNEVWIKWVAMAIFAPLIVGFFITTIEWWTGGTD
jgi:hypothetical protein